jgi:probable HAF family extracellular repeat protein
MLLHNHVRRPLAIAASSLATLALASIATIAPATAENQSAGVAGYTITEAPALQGANSTTTLTALNNLGHSAGIVYWGNGLTNHVVLWRGGSMIDLGTPPGFNISGDWVDLNNSDQLVTTAYTTTVPRVAHAFLWQDGRWRNLGTLRGGTESRATAINDGGQIVGTALQPDGPRHAVLWENGHSPARDLGTFGGRDSEAYGINRSGEVVGGAATISGEWHAFLWRHGKMLDLGVPAGVGSTASYASDINDRGQVLVRSFVPGGQFPDEHLWIWQDGRVRQLQPLPGDNVTVGNGLNLSGQVVGWSLSFGTDSGTGARAVLWQDGSTKDLNTLLPAGSGWMLSNATSINARGQITVFGMHEGVGRAGLLTPVR